MSGPILLAYDLDGEGGGKPVSDGVIGRELRRDVLAWVHLDGKHPDARLWLDREISSLDPFVVDALLAEETRPRMAEINDGALLILRGINHDENADPEDMVSIRLWIDKTRIISVQLRNSMAIFDVEERISANKGPRNPGEFVNLLLARLSDGMTSLIADLDDETDDVEERILEDPDSSLRERIISIRKTAIKLRRYIAPQRDAIGQLLLAEFSWLDGQHRRLLQENFDHLLRYIEDLDAIRERSQIMKDELANIIADKLNRHLYILSVIAAIFLPLAFLTGLFGINVGGIPGDQSPYAFAIFCGVLVILVAVQIFIFKKLKWF